MDEQQIILTAAGGMGGRFLGEQAGHGRAVAQLAVDHMELARDYL
jgi:hypothetical protein